MRPSPPVAADRFGVFTSLEAAASGWTRSGLEHAARRDRLLHLQRGVWADTSELADSPPARAADLLLLRRAIGAALATRGGIVSHLASALLHELPIWAPDPRACLTLTHRERGVLDHVHTHRSALPRGHPWAGIVFTEVERTIVDTTREFGVEAGLVTADAALHQLKTSRRRLAAEVAACPPAPGSRRIRELLALVDDRAESPLESRSRWHLAQHGVPPDRSQVVLRTGDGRFLGRCDFFWEEGVVGEVDGNVKYDDTDLGSHPDRTERRDARSREKWRQEFMERTGLLVVRWGQKDFEDFAAVAALIADRRARVQRPGWPRDWIAEASH